MSLKRASQTQQGLSPLKCALSYPPPCGATLLSFDVTAKQRMHKGTSNATGFAPVLTLGAVTTTLTVYPVKMQQVLFL